MKIDTRAIAAGLAVASMMSGASVHAALVTTDWKASGDQLVTVDTISSLQWLDLTVTLGQSIEQTQGLLASDYSGWRIANELEVMALYGHFGLPIVGLASSTSPATIANISAMSDLFGDTLNGIEHNPGWFGSYGYSLLSGDPFHISYGGALVNPAGTAILQTQMTAPYALNLAPTTIGVYLVRGGAQQGTVAEPSTLALLIAASAAAVRIQRRWA